MSKDKCCCGKLGGVFVFLVGLIVGAVIVGVLAMSGHLDSLQGKVFGTVEIQEETEEQAVVKPGVMFELDEEAPGVWVQAEKDPELDGVWVEIGEGAWAQLAKVSVETEDGSVYVLPDGAWAQLTGEGAWAQFGSNASDDTLIQLKEGAWAQLADDTEVVDVNGAWAQLSAGTKIQLIEGAWAQFKEKGAQIEGAWAQ